MLLCPATLRAEVRIGATMYFANVAYVEETLRTLIAEIWQHPTIPDIPRLLKSIPADPGLSHFCLA